MTRALEIFAIIQFAMIGLSHVFHHRAWAEFYIRLRRPGYAGVFVQGFLLLAFCSMILAFHRVWSETPLVLTIIGLVYLAKAAQCFMLPAVALRSLNRVTLERSRMFIGVGTMFLCVAGAISVVLVRAG